MSVQPFEIPSFTPEQRATLLDKLKSPVFPHEFEQNVGWSYGTPRWALEPVLQKWRDEFDWETSKAEMDRWSHFKTEIDGANIHFVHERSKNPNAIPLVLLHGWPSTFYEFHKVIEPLRDGVDNGQAFHIVVPSLPGYGFSDPPPVRGWGSRKMAAVLNTLMVRLGYTKYVAHGVDWGSILVKVMACLHDENCKAIYTTLNICMPPLPTPSVLWAAPLKVAKFLASLALGSDMVYGPGKLKIMGRSFADIDNDKDAGYRAIQGTRPFTLSYGLSDSPVGLLAWILEKYHVWTHHEGDKESAILPPTIDVNEFLTQVHIYWMTNTISSSMRLYYERLNEPNANSLMWKAIKVPCGAGLFASELAKVPRDWLEAWTNLVQFDEHPTGGHFSALEEPKLTINDLQRFGKKVKNEVE
ncbi:hypothetical protein NQZ79_g393 [Umbelopsis isabellina]|nr:hypothetical protein NQZ79_g393 [Umbelopsis isabellina]